MAPRQLLSIAPMMDWTDLYYRQLARLLTKRTWLWTEMVVDKTIAREADNLDKHLWFPPEQHPIVCQLGGSDPQLLAEATRKVVEYGYDEINLNCGCPSDRVAGAGCFGATLMLQPDLVAACMKAMGDASTGTPVTVKCRLGVDDVDSYQQLCHFIQTVSSQAPVKHFIIHARKCFLQGLNPTQNRTVPPLRHEWVFALRQDFPHLSFSLNGGIQHCYEARVVVEYAGPWPSQGQGEQSGQATAKIAAGASEQTDGSGGAQAAQSTSDEFNVQGDEAAKEWKGHGTPVVEPPSCSGMLESVMIGRTAYNDPWGCLSDADMTVFGEVNPASCRRQVLQDYASWADPLIGRWGIHASGWMEPNVRVLMKPLMNLFLGEPGSKKWKSCVDAALKDPAVTTVSAVLQRALHVIPDAVLDAPPPCQPVRRRGVPPQSPACYTYGPLPSAESTAGNNMSLEELKKMQDEQASARKGKSTRAERVAAKAAAKAAMGLSACEGVGACDDADADADAHTDAHAIVSAGGVAHVDASPGKDAHTTAGPDIGIDVHEGTLALAAAGVGGGDTDGTANGGDSGVGADTAAATP